MMIKTLDFYDMIIIMSYERLNEGGRAHGPQSTYHDPLFSPLESPGSLAPGNEKYESGMNCCYLFYELLFPLYKTTIVILILRVGFTSHQ